MRARVQKEGDVIHVICDRIVDHTDLLGQVGHMDFPHRPGRGDGATHPGGPDPRDPAWKPRARDGNNRPFDGGADPEDVVRVKTRDFR